jgi:hypothetical protein
MVWVPVSIEIIIYLENLLYIPENIHGIRNFGPIVAPQPSVYNKYEMVAAQSNVVIKIALKFKQLIYR